MAMATDAPDHRWMQPKLMKVKKPSVPRDSGKVAMKPPMKPMDKLLSVIARGGRFEAKLRRY